MTVAPVTFVLLAHPERRSFTARWAAASAAAARDAGHEVLWSDLCSMGFDPVEKASHYPATALPFDPLKAQEGHPLPPDAASEARKLRAFTFRDGLSTEAGWS